MKVALEITFRDRANILILTKKKKLTKKIFLLSFLEINIKFKTCVGKTLDWTWIRPILFRNTIVTLVTCGFWDWFLYFSPLKDKLHKYKVTFSFSKSLKLPFLWCL